ncbi:bone morphogenetic protein 1 [Sarotherodon galilaeus]
MMQTHESEIRNEKKLIKMFLITTCLLYAVILTMAVLFIVYISQGTPGHSSEHGGQSSPALPENVVAKTESGERRKREVSGKGDECLSTYNGIELNYVKGSTSSFTFDLCDVVKCTGASSSWRAYDVWVCNHPMICSRSPSWGSHIHTYVAGQWCAWENVVSWTGVGWQPYILGGVFYLVIGVDVTGIDPFGVIRVNLVDPQSKPLAKSSITTLTDQTLTSETVAQKEQEPKERPLLTTDYTRLKPQDLIERATGFKDSNLWLDWVAQNAKEQHVADCVACASARPRLFTEPAPLHPEDKWGYDCMLQLTRSAVTTGNCTLLSSLFPPIPKQTTVGPFMPKQDNYTCFKFSTDNEKYKVGEIDPTWCAVTLTGRTTNNVSDPNTVIGTWARSGLYYYCGESTLLARVPLGSVGTCAMVRLGAPLMLIGNQVKTIPEYNTRTLAARRKRHILAKRGTQGTHAYDPRLNSPTWIDSIGVPRGVPDEYKLADPVASGFESIFLWVTPNKNVDRINYVHYNLLRLSNLTRDAMVGFVEQLGPSSLMGVQNRMALDMLLAEKGGVCAMFGDMCCTFIPNNTAPDGSVTRALEGLKTLSETMHEHSGIENPLVSWMTSVFGRWKGVAMSVMFSLTVLLGILVTGGCCIIPCVRGLLVMMMARVANPGRVESIYMMDLEPIEWGRE